MSVASPRSLTSAAAALARRPGGAQDWRKAAKYFAKASDLQPEDRDAANLLAAAGHRLSQAEMSSVLEELYAPSVMERELAGVDAAGHSFRVAPMI